MNANLIAGCSAAVTGGVAGSIAQGLHANMAAWEWWKLGALALVAGSHALAQFLTDPKSPPVADPPK